MKKNLILLGCLALTMGGCSSTQNDLRRTQVVTFPKGGIVEYNGKRLGREPVLITLPQDERGNLSGRSILRASPYERMTLAETKVLEPGQRTDRVPDRILLDISPYVETASGSGSATSQSSEVAEPQMRKRIESPRGRTNRS